MSITVVVVATAALFAWGLFSNKLERADLTAPIVFIGVGAALAGLDLVQGQSDVETLTPLVEVTLVWVLFSDAARLPVQQLRRDAGRYVRLLAVGLPLTIVLGWALAAWFFPGLGVWLALFVGAALAPTDAALGVPVVTNPVVPARIRQLITVESGLNDGIATPVVMLAIAGAAAAAGLEHAEGAGGAAVELLIGVAVGAAVGGVGGAALRWARRHGTAAESFAGIAVLALALASYACALALHGNGFVAAFCGGLAFGAFAGRRAPAELEFLEQTGTLLAALVWMAFGADRRPDHAGPHRRHHRPLRRPEPHRGAGCCPSRSPRSGPGWTAPPSSSSAGSGLAGWRRWCSHCSRSRPWDRRPMRPWPW